MTNVISEIRASCNLAVVFSVSTIAVNWFPGGINNIEPICHLYYEYEKQFPVLILIVVFAFQDGTLATVASCT